MHNLTPIDDYIESNLKRLVRRVTDLVRSVAEVTRSNAKSPAPRAWVVALVGFMMIQPGVAAEQDSEAGARRGQAGYEKLPEFGGPESVGTQLKQADEERDATYRFDGL